MTCTHNHEVACHKCMYDYVIDVDDYEAVNLLWLMRVGKRLGLDTGDWHHQITWKLKERLKTSSISGPNSGPLDTEMRLGDAARKILDPPDKTVDKTVDKTAWLVELRDVNGNTMYWVGLDNWTYLPDRATRFCRMSDAAAVAGTIAKNTIVCEHMWVVPSAPNKSADPASTNHKSTP